MQKKERGRGQTPVCSRARMNNGKSSLRRSQAIKCNPTGIVQTLKTWQRRSIETKLGIIIILQDVAVARFRELDQSFPPLKAHRHTQGKLVRRCDENESGRILP